MRISDWSSDVCSSDLQAGDDDQRTIDEPALPASRRTPRPQRFKRHHGAENQRRQRDARRLRIALPYLPEQARHRRVQRVASRLDSECRMKRAIATANTMVYRSEARGSGQECKSMGEYCGPRYT